MKELSIEEKAKRYDEAFEIAKEINNEHKAQPFDVMLKVFPELKESEDEMIRMSLIELFKDMEWDDSILHDYNMDKDKTIAWLEKQGEQESVVVIPKFRVGDVIRPKGSTAEYTIESISGECYHGKGCGLHIGCEEDYELVEQKPTGKVNPKFHEGEWITIKE